MLTRRVLRHADLTRRPLTPFICSEESLRSIRPISRNRRRKLRAHPVGSRTHTATHQRYRPLSCATIFFTAPCCLREPAHARVNHTYAICPTIHPKEAFANQTYRGKVVLITGASRGIGQETAITYAMAGAKVTLMGRSQEALSMRLPLRCGRRSQAQALAVSADARISQATLERLDVLIANLNAGDVSDLNQSTWVSIEEAHLIPRRMQIWATRTPSAV
ncbi:hypothetical protein EDB86DRAFT_325528 [Lactarius hatsudake]|nr:hypothetical protein EDB86DRAFT_325528 [Lactarius hatsudake]